MKTAAAAKEKRKEYKEKIKTTTKMQNAQRQKQKITQRAICPEANITINFGYTRTAARSFVCVVFVCLLLLSVHLVSRSGGLHRY